MTQLQNLWEHSAAENFQGIDLTSNISVDLAIIGAGYTGLSAAIEAANLGAKVIVLEAKTVGFGGSGRNVGLVNAGLWLPPKTVINTLGEIEGNRLNQVLAQAPQAVYDLIEKYSISCEPVRNGTLHCAHSKPGFSELKRRYRQLVNLGAPVTLLDADETKHRTGSRRFYGALHDARAGTIQPLSYARGLARAAFASGAVVYENTRVDTIQKTGDAWILKMPNANISCEKLLVATNAYHHKTDPTNVPNVTSVNFFQMATDPLPDSIAKNLLPQKEGCWDTGTIMTSFRMDAQNRFIIGGMGHPNRLGIHQSWARRIMARLYPELGNVPLQHCWSGKISMTPDHIPKLLKLGSNGFAMFGYSGRGIGPGTIMGCAIAKTLITGDETGLPLCPTDVFAETAPTIKTKFYELGAQTFHLIDGRIG